MTECNKIISKIVYDNDDDKHEATMQILHWKHPVLQ